MRLHLPSEEPEAKGWQILPLRVLAERALQLGQGRRHQGDRAVVLGVDGRSSSGKTSLAARLADAVPGTAVVHTDDVAWGYARFDWAGVLTEGVLRPARAGQPVAFRPPGWDKVRRAGDIGVPAGCHLIVIEGVGATRRETRQLTDVAIWVQADERETERRCLARIGTQGGPPTRSALRDWMAEENPFLAEQRPWEHADFFVCGTPRLLGLEPDHDTVVATGRDEVT